MQKNLSQVQQSTVKDRLLDWDMKMGCHATFFLQRLHLFPRGYIILGGTHSFHAISGDSPENLRKLSVYGKFHHPGNWTKKPAFYAVNAWKPLSILEKIWWLDHHFIIKKNKNLYTRLRKPNYESSLVANILDWGRLF